MTSQIRADAPGTKIAETLADTLGSSVTIVDPEVKASYEVDFTGRYRGQSSAVVQVRTAGDVEKALSLCRDARVGVVPQGGNTGLVGGGVPRSGEVILSTVRMGAVEDVDEHSGEIVVEAGVTLAHVQKVARDIGLSFGVDLASRDSATIGGMIATNAGGHHVLKYGTMSSQVVGIEAVMADGLTIERLAGLRKDNTGYDLSSLMAGSEGTLGVITRARLRLVPQEPHRVVVLVGTSGLASALSLAHGLWRRNVPLAAAEVFFDEGLELILNRMDYERPVARADAYLLLELQSQTDPLPQLAVGLEQAGHLETNAVLIGTDGPTRTRLWAFRELLPDVATHLGTPLKFDVSLPLRRMAEFEAKVRLMVAERFPQLLTLIWGHLLDGNLHINLLGGPGDVAEVERCVYKLTVDCGGSISAEHGIGVAKVPWLIQDRGASDVHVMRAIKNALDPNGLMNPGVLFS